jgi:hypothetical protein
MVCRMSGANKIQTDNLTRRGAGRPKGSPNKLAKAAKDAIAEAAELLGGMKRLAAWAKESPENEKAFWATIYPKLIPVQVTGENGGAVEIKITREIVKQ